MILYACPGTDLEAEYYVGQKLKDKWQILETAPSAYQAFIARSLIISRDQQNRMINPEDDYKVFKKDLNEIQIMEAKWS